MSSLSNWSKLPTEIASLIFLNLFKPIDEDDEFNMYSSVDFDNGRAIDRCALVCQSWRVVAQTIRFSRVMISTEKKLNNIVNVSLPTRKLVKTVNYDILGTIKGKHGDNLKLIATSFPFLEKLRFNPKDEMFLTISDLITEKKLSYLKEITAPTNEYQAKLYASITLALKDRVNGITIFSKYSRQCGSILYDELLSNIYQFPKLNRLEITTSFNQYDTIANFVESKIGNLDIETMHLYIESLNQKPPQVPDKVEEDKIKPSRNLKKLLLTCTGEAHCNDDKSLLFIMKKYPNVENIRFRNAIEAFGPKRYNIPSVSVGVQFLTYLYKMPRYSIKDFITDQNTGEILSQMYEKFDETTNPKFRNVLSIVYMEENGTNRQGNNTSLVINKATKNGVIFRKVQADFKIRDGEEDQPYYDVIEKAGKYIHEMTITEDVFYTKRSLLHCIIKNCVRLESLTLNNMYATLFFLKPENTTVDVIDHIRHGLKHLHMGSGILYSDKFLRISACFPHLEVLEMLYSNPIDQSIKNYLPMVMPELSLKRLVITKGGKYHVDLNKFFFQLTTTENNQVIYFSVKISPPDDGYNRPKDPEDDDEEGYRVAKITSAEYETSKRTRPLIAISIQCQALDELVLKYETSFFQVNHVHCLAELSKAQ